MFNLHASPSTFGFRSMQSFVRENKIACADRRDRSLLESAVAGWQETQKELIAAAADLKFAAEQSTAESNLVADRVEVVATDIAVKAVTVLTSPEAVDLYKGTLRVLALSIAFVAFMSLSLARWCWERREHTALFHWIQDGLNSEFVSTLDRTATQLREWVALQLVRVGCI